jgi:hypothetical protein
VARKIPEGAVQPGKADQRIEQRLQLLELCPCIPARAADDGAERRHDLQIVPVSPVVGHASLHIGVVGLCLVQRVWDGIDYISRRGRDLAALFRRTGLKDDWMALRHAGDVQRSPNLEISADVVQRMGFALVEKPARGLVE